MDLKNKKVTVVGLGNSGISAAVLLNDAGAKVRVTDSHDTPSIRKGLKVLEGKNIEVEIGKHTEGFIKGIDLMVLSPGVEDTALPVRSAVTSGIPIISEMELGFRFCKGKIIAITGTNGKSTVTTLIGKILKAGGKDAVVCGNIGNSLCGEINRIKDNTWVVLEVSSFQLERTEEFRPHIALILNITDDHMDRYKSFDEYFNEKLKIFYNQTEDDVLILNYDAENLRGLKDRASARVLFYSRVKNTNGAYVKDGKILCVSGSTEKEICGISDIRLKGLHNIENVLASSLTGTLVGVDEAAMRDTIRSFRGLAHRFETVDVIDGVEYIDDSKGTTVDSTYRALESCEKPVILIAGGKDKNSDYSLVREIVRKKVRHLVLIGEAKEKIRKALEDVVQTHEAKDMFDALYIAQGLADKDFLVLLSPMCSSFDMFKDYKHRGEVFREAVMNIKASGPTGRPTDLRSDRIGDRPGGTSGQKAKRC